MKKFLSVFLVLVMLLSLAACGGNESDAQKENGATLSENQKDEVNNKVTDDGKITVEKVRNAPETSADDFTTELVDGGLSLEKYIGDDNIVVVPEKIDGLPIVSVGEFCFANNETIKGVRISDSVINIETNAFLNCANLEVVISGKNMESIGEYALSYCKSLSYLELNDGIKSLGLSCLVATHSLYELYMPLSLTDINSPFLIAETKVTIITEAGSAAETYAKENGIKYEIR